MDTFAWRSFLRTVFACMFAGAILAVVVFAPTAMAGDKYTAMINCDVQKGACTLPLKDRTVTLAVLPRPVIAMESLTFKVGIDGDTSGLAAPQIRLNMPAMDMGKNTVTMELNKDGVYEGQGVIVRCRSGRRTWQATVDFPDIGKADFIFDVIYK